MKLSYEENPKEIIDKLLEHHDVQTLRGILNSKARKKEPRGNDFFTIAVDVYLTQYWHKSKLEWAIDQVAEMKNISDKTVKNHITKFRAYIKDHISELAKDPGYDIDKNTDVSSFIQLYIEVIDQNNNPYHNHYRTYADYKKLFLDDFISRTYSVIPF